MRIIALDELNIKYSFRKTNGKKVSFKIKEQDGSVVINYYKYLKQKDLLEIINNNIDKIVKLFKQHQNIKVKYINGAEILIFGKVFYIKVIKSKKNNVYFNEHYLIIETINEEIEYVRKIVLKFLDEQFLISIELIFNKCFNNMRHLLDKYPIVNRRYYSSRWGSCFYNKNLVVLNKNLVAVPVHLIRFVIFHELTHFLEHNHSPKFYKILAEFVPNHKELKKELSKYSFVNHYF